MKKPFFKIFLISQMVTILLAISSCVTNMEDPVTVTTTNLLNSVNLIYENELIKRNKTYDLGDYLKGSVPIVIPILVYNKSSYDITDIQLEFLDNLVGEYTFEKEDNDIGAFPGINGTCGDTLKQGAYCYINLQFSSSDSAIFTQKFRVSYKNLVEEESYKFKLTILSGEEADLVFDGEIDSFKFGEPDADIIEGTSERSLKKTYTQVLNVTNIGELSAQNLIQALAQNCKPEVDADCPESIAEPFSYENVDCPDQLKGGKSCQVIVTYSPLNQADTELQEAVNYSASMRFSFVKNPLGETGSATASFSSFSTDIKADIITTKETISFGSSITTGNRLSTTIKFKNQGYRTGYINALHFYNSTDPDAKYSCYNEGSEYLTCYDNLSSLVTTKDIFPFYFKDESNCLSSDKSSSLAANATCTITAFFQPSITQTSGQVLLYKTRIGYDNRFLGQESAIPADRDNPTADEPVNFEISGTFLSAAKIEVTSITQSDPSLSPTIVNESDGVYYGDFGKVSVMYPTAASSITLNFTFKNVGETTARDVVVSDGSGVILNFDTDNDIGGSDLGSVTPVAYQAIKPETVSCKSILPESQCTIKVTFIPISRADDDQLYASLFDYVDDADSSQNYKGIQLQYDDGSKFTDDNYTESADTSVKTTLAKYRFTPVTAGILSGPTIVKSFDKNFIAPEPTFMILVFENSGTGVIPYISNDGTFCNGMDDCPVDDSYATNMLSYVSEDDPTYSFSPSTYGADHDCSKLFDWDATYSVADQITLNPGESCALKILGVAHNATRNTINGQSARPSNTYYRSNNATKLFDLDTSEPVELWEHFYANLASSSFAGFYFDYYDSDNDPSEPSYVAGLGKLMSLSSNQNIQVSFNSPAKLIPADARPYMSSTIYRPAFSLSTLYAEDGTTVLNSGVNYSEYWFYFPYGYISSTFSDPTNLSAGTFPYVYRGMYSQGHVDDYLDTNGVCADCEYTIHFGTFPVNSTQELSFGIANLQHVGSNRGGTISNITFNADSNNYMSMDTVLSDLTARTTRNNSEIIEFTFIPTTSGASVATFEYTYNTGVVSGTPNTSTERTIKIQMIAEAIDDAPILDFSYRKFDVIESEFPNTPPSESLATDCDGSGNPCPLYHTQLDESFDPQTGDENFDLSIVKVEAIDENSMYVKKRLYIENTSTSLTLNDFSIVRRTSPSASTESKNTIDGLDLSSTCDIVTSMAPGESCYIDFTYQSTMTSSEKNYSYTFRYRINDYQYYNQNVSVNLIPLDAGEILPCEDFLDCTDALVLDTKNIYIDSAGSTGEAYEIDIEDEYYYKEDFTIQRELTLANGSDGIRVSLLKAWHKYIEQEDSTPAEVTMGSEYNDSSPAPESLHPTADLFTDIDGRLFIPVYKEVSTAMSSTINVLARDTCFYGEYASHADLNYTDLDANERGFLSTDDELDECNVIVTLTVGINYIAQTISNSSAFVKIAPNTIELPYYNYKRDNSSVVLIYFKITVNPDIAITTNTSDEPFFYNVEAYSDQTAEFSFKNATPGSTGAGQIDGYRIYYSQSPTSFDNDNFYKAGTSVSFIDQEISDGPTGVSIDYNTLTDLMSAYYFKVMAIRSNGDYTASTFDSLASGKYLSDIKLSYNDSSLPNLLRIVVPNTDYAYVHDANALLKLNYEKPNGAISPVDYEGAITTCSSLTSESYYDNGTVTPSFSLINPTIWEYIRNNSYASEYDTFDPLQVPHWVYTSTQYDISSLFSSYSGYKSSAQSQRFDSSSEFYFRCTDGCSSDQIMAGGFWETDLYDYTSYVGRSQPVGQARCYLDVAP